MNSGADAGKQALFHDLDKYCKHISGKLSRGHGCMKLAFGVIAIAVGAAIISPNVDALDWKRLSVVFSS